MHQFVPHGDDIAYINANPSVPLYNAMLLHCDFFDLRPFVDTGQLHDFFHIMVGLSRAMGESPHQRFFPAEKVVAAMTNFTRDRLAHGSSVSWSEEDFLPRLHMVTTASKRIKYEHPDYFTDAKKRDVFNRLSLLMPPFAELCDLVRDNKPMRAVDFWHEIRDMRCDTIFSFVPPAPCARPDL